MKAAAEGPSEKEVQELSELSIKLAEAVDKAGIWIECIVAAGLQTYLVTVVPLEDAPEDGQMN